MRNGMFAKHVLQLAVVAVVAAVGLISNASAAVVFQDTFGTGSTINQTSTPSGGNLTSYDIGSARAATSTIASGDLNITQAVSSSTIAQAQAVFSATPITLASANDFIELTVTFTTSGGKSATGAATAGLPTAAYFGLYNSGGSVPYTDLMHGSTTSVPQTGIQSGATGDTTGGVQNYQGYVANVQGGNSTQSYKIQTRPKQTGTSNVNQDLVSAGASSSQSYAGAQILGSTVNPGSVQFAVGSTFTEDFTITMTAGGTYTLVSNLYSGAGTSGTLLVTTNGLDPTNPTPPAVPIGPFNYNGFDALAFGDRETDSLGDAIDVSSVTVQTNVAVSTPEPASLGLLAMGGMMLIARRRKA